MAEKVDNKTVKQIRTRIEEDLVSQLKKEAKDRKMSLSTYVNFILNSSLKKEEPSFDETFTFPEKKEIESRVFFTQSEMELLKKYAELNQWSVSKEVRYRTTSTLAKKPKLNKEELKAIYSTRSAINILGANLNRLIRNNQVISDHNISFCHELSSLITELQSKINFLMKCGNTNFKLKSR